MNLDNFLLILSHTIFLLLGYLAHSAIHKHTSNNINTFEVQQASTVKRKSEPSVQTAEKIRKIHIDTRKVVVNDIDNEFEKHFDTLGNTKTEKDNIEQVVNKLAQLKKNNGGDNG
jgi:hypothetical protein